ncbi:23 kDa jasmonate-induced protein-like [Malania oleifera]|uniref:23 kDa jasmonate-induced protein-like n=1 Tax=Malania oleifera TaxID=397392 RepID=UPI0025AE303E|nr:23 kDa jasmonate-induced protein-like [Malania oleifera]
MASNVFGTPITDSTLQSMPEYPPGKPITAEDRARVAVNMKNAENKAANALTFVENQKARYGYGVSTQCLVYNATGNTLCFVKDHDYHGHIDKSPYPTEIANGQWGAFLHVHPTAAATGSSACVVYRGKNNGGQDCDWLIGWSNPWDHSAFSYGNRAYTEIKEAHDYDQDNIWSQISSRLYNAGHDCTAAWNGCTSKVICGKGTTATFEATLCLENVSI